jgi:pSer/pThr/pTyr-binding forkhead associated (FHA) protein
VSVKLYVVRGSEQHPAADLGTKVLSVGRHSNNGLVLDDATVSSFHASFWLEGGRVFVKDLGSLNGTFVDEVRVVGIQEVVRDGKVRLGLDTVLVVDGEVAASDGADPMGGVLLVRDLQSGVAKQVLSNRFYLGSGENAHFTVEGAGEHDVALAFHPDGEIWISTFDDERPLEVGAEFSVGERRFQLIRGSTTAETVLSTEEGFPYRLRVTLDGVTGAEATLEDTKANVRHTIAAENRAVLLYVLAKRAVEAREAGGVPGSEAEWCADEDVARDIWGKKGTGDANSLHVLVHRLRKEIRKAGFDPWFIEKRRRAIRIALTDLEVKRS